MRAAASNHQIKPSEARMGEIVSERAEGVLQIQFNRVEKKNALTMSMYSTITEFLGAADDPLIGLDKPLVAAAHGAAVGGGTTAP
jgi:enoyl-CoA hydratase/carnithine racemase